MEGLRASSMVCRSRSGLFNIWLISGLRWNNTMNPPRILQAGIGDELAHIVGVVHEPLNQGVVQDLAHHIRVAQYLMLHTSMKLAEPIPRASRPPKPPRDPRPNGVAPTSADKWSALFNFQSLLTVILLLICTCAYIRSIFPSLLDRNKVGYVLINSSFTSRHPQGGLERVPIVLIHINRNVLEMCSDRRKEESLCCVLLRHNGGKHLVLVIDFDPLEGSSTTEPRPSNYIYYRADLSYEQ
uniref:Protein kish-A n=1 Tax=Timema bartmani TaxID=61472 RepID=A0A7R9F4X2_9NEOP|nr:unnamed protein product [Timema bartmani]